MASVSLRASSSGRAVFTSALVNSSSIVLQTVPYALRADLNNCHGIIGDVSLAIRSEVILCQRLREIAAQHRGKAAGENYAPVLLDAGESIKAVSEYLGHSDPGLTLKVYAHLMPSSRDRARKALGQALRPPEDSPR
ncbi:hypothetical protein GCM10010284_63960 [Streptomyces rubiginosohelvolus]|nr:hypothetical protein GCM10010284_63960 [Streptomyces rubiginosohelvolus]